MHPPTPPPKRRVPYKGDPPMDQRTTLFALFVIFGLLGTVVYVSITTKRALSLVEEKLNLMDIKMDGKLQDKFKFGYVPEKEKNAKQIK